VTAQRTESTPSLLLLRHGQSTTNASGRFTGWTDVPLTDDGEREARRAGELLRDAEITPEVVHTSLLRRSIRTVEIVLDVLDRPWLPVRRTWRLNERHYGALTGRVKSEVRTEVGDERYRAWRRSYREAPPPLRNAEGAGFRDDPRYAELPPGTVPDTESLADVRARLLPYWIDTLAAELRAGRTPLVVAHGNSLRAMVMHLDGLTEAQVSELNIPTGIPLEYRLDPRLRPYPGGGRYLDRAAAAQASAAVAGEGHA
jgi:2,3-bisphosphoglycerate-dependent phosphoglycerate mutase